MLDAAVANARRWGVALCQSVRSAFDALAASARRRAQRLVAAVRQRRDALVSSPRRLREAAWRWWRRDRTVSHVLRHSRAGRWYVVLRCRRGATKRQLREAYRRRAKRTHPDKTSDDRANAAFDALRRNGAENDLETVGAKLRGLMPWLKEQRLVDRSKN